eukprot:TRINITY_DN11657_c0_g1_i1.p1 TRINITY_DN11657_c0_g1~~TRINITY_DN11657_c0_g1_i1.p1  ORF type:complete len:239 (-),score=57.68 TRINITY_DN11657_c0_g1_i1:179-895(-)
MGCVASADPLSSPQMELTVQCDTAETLSITVHTRQTVRVLLAKVAEKLQIPLSTAELFEFTHSHAIISDFSSLDRTFEALSVKPPAPEGPVVIYLVGMRRLQQASEADLIDAAKTGDTAVVKLVCKYCPRRSDEQHAEDKGTALHWASNYGHLEAARELIKAGANLECRDTLESTPLLAAAAAGREEVVKELIEAKADVNAQGKDGCTALYWADTLDNQTLAFMIRQAGGTHSPAKGH